MPQCTSCLAGCFYSSQGSQHSDRGDFKHGFNLHLLAEWWCFESFLKDFPDNSFLLLRTFCSIPKTFFLIQLFISLGLIFWVLYMLWIWILPGFLPFCALPSCTTVSFAVQMVCNSTKPCLSIADLMPWAARFLFWTSEAVPVSCSVFLTLSSYHYAAFWVVHSRLWSNWHWFTRWETRI